MAGTITTSLSNAFKLQLLKGNHDFDTDMKVILLKEESALSTNYGAATVSSGAVGTDEVSHSSYDGAYSRNVLGAGNGATVSIANTFPKMDSNGTTAIIDFDDTTFANVTVVSDGAILYNPNAGDPNNDVIAVFSFGGTVSASAGNFVLQYPSPGSSTSILRLD